MKLVKYFLLPADMLIKGWRNVQSPQKREADHGNIEHGYEQL